MMSSPENKGNWKEKVFHEMGTLTQPGGMLQVKVDNI